MIEILLNLWPWWTGFLLFVWWYGLYEGITEAGTSDPLALARGCVTALTLLVTIAWIITLPIWVMRLA